MRPSMVCKALVSIGGYSRGGMRRRDSQAADHDMRCEEQDTPFLKRLFEFTDRIGKSICLHFCPPHHSKYNPLVRCWRVWKSTG